MIMGSKDVGISIKHMIADVWTVEEKLFILLDKDHPLIDGNKLKSHCLCLLRMVCFQKSGRTQRHYYRRARALILKATT
jgi:hypothetical protein